MNSTQSPRPDRALRTVLRRFFRPSPLLATVVVSIAFLHPVSCSDPDGPNGWSADGTGGSGQGGGGGDGGTGSTTGTGGSTPGGSSVQVPPTHSVQLVLSLSGVELLSVAPYDALVPGAEPLERSRQDALWWFVKDSSGKTVAGGMVLDPRIANVDPGPTGEPAGTDRTPFAMLQLDIPVGEGMLQLFEQPIGSTTLRADGCNGPSMLGEVDLGSGGSGGGDVSAQSIPGLRKIVDHGICKGNVNILIMSEGYTSAELSTFRADASKVASGLQKYKVFADHWDQVNIWSLEVASTESGIDDPDKGIQRDTPFGVSYGTGGLHHCTLAKAPKPEAKTLWQKAQKATRANAIAILANDKELGGCAQGNTATITNGYWETFVFAHELGHAILGLEDEYIVKDKNGNADDSRCNLGYVREVNATRNGTKPPWMALVNTKQLPTTSGSSSTIGAFEGAHYCSKNVYRPSLNCMMNDNWHGADWCPVCYDVGSKWFEGRKAKSANDTTCKPNCFGGGMTCSSGTVCSWNGNDYGYCCRKPFTAAKTCFTDSECSGGICAFGGPPNNFFYCTQPDSTATCAK